MTQELSKSFNPKEIEERWYKFWESEGYYRIGKDLNNPINFSILVINDAQVILLFQLFLMQLE